MWYRIADFIIKYRILLLSLLILSTAFFGYHASKVQLSYDFTNAIPRDNPKYQVYQDFIKAFGEDGNTLMIGVQTDQLFDSAVFNDYVEMLQKIEVVPAVNSVLAINKAVKVVNDSIKKINIEQLLPKDKKIFTAAEIAHFKTELFKQPFFEGLLYNPQTQTFLAAIRLDKNVLASKQRTGLNHELLAIGNQFGEQHKIEMHYSGLPHIRTNMANMVQSELVMFLLLSFAFTAIILFIFFRSFTAVITSLIVVGIGVVWSFGTIALCGYKITLLTGVIPSLVVVIGIPNCIYFLNKYHMAHNELRSKIPALREMVGKMGIVTLFTNLTAAIGFGVFYFTESVILKEFGLVAGLNILALFVISLIFIPIIFSYIKAPATKHTNYLENPWINKTLDGITHLVFNNRKKIYLFTGILCVAAIAGMFRLKAVGYIVDDLPKTDKLYTDLQFFEQNFKGIMPLEVVVDTRKKYGAVSSLATWEKVDSLTNYLEADPRISKALSLVKGIKFAKQGMLGGEPENFVLLNSFEYSGIRTDLIRMLRQQDLSSNNNQFAALLKTFTDTAYSKIRISVNIADIGSVAMPEFLDSLKPVINTLFDTADYQVTVTGTSITFLEGSSFIINSLKESLVWAFAMIIVCMVMLFKSGRIVLIAIVTNLIPILLTAGIMGWLGVRLKPSTVLVFSVALGITVDVTIRFLVNFKQDLQQYQEPIENTIKRTIRDTGLSIICTSVILIAGFAIFALSNFQGTKSLGFLTSLTLFLAMIFNLTLQPALLVLFGKWKDKKQNNQVK